MKIKWFVVILALLSISCIAGVGEKEIKLSGTLEEGLRLITLDGGKDGDVLHVYRGDYVRFLLADDGSARLKIRDMDVDTSVPLENPEQPYIKFKESGTFPFSLDDKKGMIIVHEYVKLHYTEVTAKEAQDILDKRGLLILDVRTKGEYNRGHLKNALLIPVGELQKRIKELAKYKKKPLFIYCATGNRSTVASKILQDQGFSEIYNLRRGISGWVRGGYKIID